MTTETEDMGGGGTVKELLDNIKRHADSLRELVRAELAKEGREPSNHATADYEMGRADGEESAVDQFRPHVEALTELLDDARENAAEWRQRAEEAEADCAAMRENYAYIIGAFEGCARGNYPCGCGVAAKNVRALSSSDAGKALLARVAKLEVIADAARFYRDTPPIKNREAFERIRDALAAHEGD